MSEKTPRQIGAEAKALYAEHKDVSPVLEWANDAVENDISQVQHFHNKANALESGTIEPELDFTPEEDAQRRRSMRDEKMKDLVASVLKQGEFKVISDINLEKAAEHYKQNSAAYHDLGVLEAAMDDVHINVQSAKNVEEHNQANQK